MYKSIAIIGVAFRFAQAETLASFWDILKNKIDLITESKRFDENILGAFLDDINCFDGEFFNIVPEEAKLIDPQHRFLLETSWLALEDAGIIPKNLAGSDTSVFIGIGSSDYFQLIGDTPVDGPGVDAGNDRCMAANRISYYYDFHGTSLSIDTACSSALVAIDAACRSLWTQESSLALVGGVNLILSPGRITSSQQAGLITKDRCCKVFDADADGYIQSEGVGMLVLKPLAQAQADGDRIYGKIIATGVNHNGRSNTLTSPNLQAQVALLEKVYQQFNINPTSINYVETHATGTPIGDALELKALGKVLGKNRPKNNPCLVGSVKTNLGHTEAVSGIAGLIKVLLCLQHRQLVPNLHFHQPNPAVNFEKLRLKVQETLEDLDPSESPLRMAVSSFGFGGTNAHLVVEEAPNTPSLVNSKPLPVHIFTISAKTETALRELAKSYVKLLTQETTSLGDLCYSVNTKRSQFNHRLFIVADSVTQLQNSLNLFLENHPNQLVFTNKVSKLNKKVDISSLVENQSLDTELLLQIGYLWLEGSEINWSQIYAAENYQYISLPSYPFQRQSYWFSENYTNLDQNRENDFNVSEAIPSNEIEAQLLAIWKEILHQNNITTDANFFKLGGTSLLVVELCSKIQTKLNKKVLPALIFEFPTIEKLAKAIIDNQENSDSSLTIINYQANLKTLITVNSFNQVQSLANQYLSESCSILNLNIFKFPETFKQEICATNPPQIIEVIASKMVADLVKAKLEQPYYLICYCGDAILTLEIAQQLAKINHQVKSIIFIDGTFKYHQPTIKDRYQTISKLGLDYISIKVKNKLKIINRNKNKPKEVKKNQQISLDNQFYQTYLSGRNEYSAEPYNGKIILLLSTEWQSADLSKIKKIAINYLEIHQIHGMHHYLFEEPYVEELTKTIKECLK